MAISARGGVPHSAAAPRMRRKIFQLKKHLFNEATVPFKKGIANEIVGRIDSALDERRRPYFDGIRIDGRDLCRSRQAGYEVSARNTRKRDRSTAGNVAALLYKRWRHRS